MLVQNSLVCSRLYIYFHCARKYCNCLENFCILEQTEILFIPWSVDSEFQHQEWDWIMSFFGRSSFVRRRALPMNKTLNECLCLYVNFSVIILKYLNLVNSFSDLFSVLTFVGIVVTADAVASPAPTVLLLSVLYLK